MMAALTIVEKTNSMPRPLKDQSLLAFSKNGRPFVGSSDSSMFEITFDDATRNIIIFGGTGRGKTESVMLPAAARLIDTGCTGLILDAKGDFSGLAEQFPESALVIGPASSTRINLIGGIETATFRAIIENLQSHYHKNEKYWGMTGVEDAVLIYLYIVETGLQPTLKDIHDGLVNPNQFCMQLERYLRQRERVSEELLLQIESRSIDEFGLLRLGEFNGMESDSSRAQEQYSWQTNAIVRSLAVIVNNPLLSKAFCTTDSPSVYKLTQEDRKTLILDMNADQYPDTSFTVARMLRLQFMRSVTISQQIRRKNDFGTNTYSFLLVDEYQQYINAGLHQQSDALRDDNTWFDRSRSYGHINVVATQSVSSLYAQVDETAAETIIQNCQNSIILPTTDVATLKRAAVLCNDSALTSQLSRALINPQGLGEGFVHIANSSSLRGGSMAGLMRAGTITKQEYAFMNAFIGKKRMPSSAPPEQSVQLKSLSNPYAKTPPGESNGRLHVVVNRSNKPDLNWLHLLTEHPKVTFVGIIDFLSWHDAPWAYRSGHNDYASCVQTGDIVVIPSFEDPKQASVLKSHNCIELAKELRDSQAGIIFSTNGQSSVELERIADAVLRTPEDLVTFVHRLLASNIRVGHGL